MKPASIILSPPGDGNALSVSWGLRANGVTPLWGASLAEAVFGELSIEIDGDGWTTSAAYSAYDLRSVWWRRARAPQAPAAVLASDAEFVSREWLVWQNGIFALSTSAIDALWINRPEDAERTENKLIQLRAARKLGIDFPETLVSNDPKRVRQFIARHGRVVFKSFVPHTWKDHRTDRMYNAAVTILDDIGAVDDASIAMCPGIYQRYVEKVCDLRVTVIGERFFTARISRHEGGAFVDWRPRTYMPDLHAQAYALPAGYEAKLSALMRELGIVFGCIDLVADAEGKLHFLEVNQTGQYLFVEELVPELPLLRAMCAMLAEGRTDYSLDRAAPLSIAQCRETDWYREWSELHLAERTPANWAVTSE
ncbi:MAG: hypothetical protein ABIQ70_05990 [Dokdonella sp.]